MALLNCSECGNQVNENDNVCQNCGNSLSTFKETQSNEIIENIEKIKEAANIIDILLKIVAILLLVIGFFCLLGWDDEVIAIAISCGITGIFLLIMSNFVEAFIKWKAYMLETNYRIVKNTECEKNGFNKL